MNKVFAVVVTYNGMAWADKCLSSLVNSTTPVTIIVVDNGSTDGTINFIKNKFPQVVFIDSKSNLGFGKANNLGIQMAMVEGADYVFLLNQDAWIEPHTIQNLITIHLAGNQNFGIISPMHLNAEYTALDYSFSKYIAPPYCDGLYSDIYTKNLKAIYPLPFVNAATWLLSKACINTVGVFDELFFHYGEDRNYCQRVLYYGYKIGVCPSERIVHDRGNRKGVAKGYDGKAERQRMMLVKMADVNKVNSNSIHNKMRGMALIKLLKSITTADIKGAKENLSDYLFLTKNIKLAKESIIRNKKVF